MPTIHPIVHQGLVMNQKLTVSYEGKDYDVTCSAAAGFVEVELSWGSELVGRMKRQVASGNPASIARMMALEILRGAKERGELN